MPLPFGVNVLSVLYTNLFCKFFLYIRILYSFILERSHLEGGGFVGF